jgi:hypothetical protein
VLLLLFFILQATGSFSFYQAAKTGKGYNSPSWRNEKGINWIIDNVPGNAVIYSDVAEGVGFLIKRPIRSLPQSGNKAVTDEFIEELRSEGNPFIICFKEIQHRPYLLSNNELAEANEKYGVLVIVADFPTSTVWQVRY